MFTYFCHFYNKYYANRRGRNAKETIWLNTFNIFTFAFCVALLTICCRQHDRTYLLRGEMERRDR